MCAIVGAVVAALLYVPAYVSAGYSFGFLDYAIGEWSLLGYVARFVIRNVYFWGIPGVVAVAVLCLPSALRASMPRERQSALYLSGAGFWWRCLWRFYRITR